MANEYQFPVPFSIDELRNDLLTVHLLQMRISALFGTDEGVFLLFGRQLPSDYRNGSLYAADLDASEYGLDVRDVLDTTVSRALEQQYAFAFHGVLTTGLEPMEYETMHTWLAAYLMDMHRSATSTEWESCGFKCDDALERCLHTSELANARLTLEGREHFSYFQRARPEADGDEATALDALTIRQVALLVGMEEMSVRTAASRKGPNQLPTYKEDGRTLVRREDAIEWLKSKSRYIPVTRKWDGPELQLDRTKFADLGDAEAALVDYLRKQAIERPGSQMRKQVKELIASRGHEQAVYISQESAADPQLLKEMADILKLPADLFALRIEQAFHAHRLRQLDQAIKRTVKSTV